MLDARKHGWITDLVAVQVQDRQYRSVGDGVEKLIRLPRGGQRSGLRLAVADDAGDDQAGIVEGRPKGVAERVSQFPTLVNRTGRRRRDMAGDTPGERELLEQQLEAGFILAYVGIDFAPGAFEVDVAHNRGASVAGAGDVEHIQVILLDGPVQVNIDEVLAWRRAPVGNHQRLDVR